MARGPGSVRLLCAVHQTLCIPPFTRLIFVFNTRMQSACSLAAFFVTVSPAGTVIITSIIQVVVSRRATF